MVRECSCPEYAVAWRTGAILTSVAIFHSHPISDLSHLIKKSL
jgi:proteasome lid subunit RPN8/RPN11